jgi:hypothetical protein
VQWTRQFGPASSLDVTLDSSGNVYVLSRETGFRIRKFSPSGTLLKTITNTTDDGDVRPVALAVDSTGNIFVLEGEDDLEYVKLFKYNNAGTLLASPDVFPSDAFPSDIIVDSSNNLYISVDTGYVRKLNNAGATLWTVNTSPGVPFALALGNTGNVYVTGLTYDSFTGFSNKGWADIFVLRLSSTTGARLWTRQFGGNRNDWSTGIAVSDAIYVSGLSYSNPNLVGVPNYCNCDFVADPFLAQLNPTTGAILGIDQ